MSIQRLTSSEERDKNNLPFSFLPSIFSVQITVYEGYPARTLLPASIIFLTTKYFCQMGLIYNGRT